MFIRFRYGNICVFLASTYDINNLGDCTLQSLIIISHYSTVQFSQGPYVLTVGTIIVFKRNNVGGQ
jgi:hypothetical protein